MVIQHGDVKWIHVGTDEQFANWKASPFWKKGSIIEANGAWLPELCEFTGNSGVFIDESIDKYS